MTRHASASSALAKRNAAKCSIRLTRFLCAKLRTFKGMCDTNAEQASNRRTSGRKKHGTLTGIKMCEITDDTKLLNIYISLVGALAVEMEVWSSLLANEVSTFRVHTNVSATFVTVCLLVEDKSANKNAKKRTFHGRKIIEEAMSRATFQLSDFWQSIDSPHAVDALNQRIEFFLRTIEQMLHIK